MKTLHTSSFLLFVIVGLVGSVGCNLIGPGKNGGEASLLPKETQNTYTVMLKGFKPETKPITEGMTVQGVIEDSGAKRKFGKMDIVIKRMVPGKPQRHNLKVDYDRGKKRVPYDQDYSIYPNDIVMISPDNTTQLDKVVDALSGVLGGKKVGD